MQTNQVSGSQDNRESPSEIITNLALNLPSAVYFSNEMGDAFAAFEHEGRREVLKVRSQPFKLWLTHLYFDKTGKAPASDTINQAIGVLEMMSLRKGECRKLELRVARDGDSFYYNPADKTGRAFRVSPGQVTIIQKPPLLFYQTRSTAAQTEPDLTGKLSRLFDHVSLTNESDRLLLLIYIVSCFIPGIPHPILIVSGEKGAAKSTMIRMIRSIVDPSPRQITAMPAAINDLALNLANSYMPSYDNLDSLSAEKSDLLCMASTGGGFPKRALYTDMEEITFELQRCITLNGISNIASRSDLLDRSIVIDLMRIDEEHRKEERLVWEAFERDKPGILGGALRILSEAMEIYPNVELTRLFRMADFTRWGYAIAEAAGVGGQRFLKAYEANIERANAEAIDSHPVAAGVIALMDKRLEWTGTVADLLSTLERVALSERINTHSKSWPRAAHSLSKRLKEVKSNLEKKHIFFDIRPIGPAKQITLERKTPETATREADIQAESQFSESE